MHLPTQAPPLLKGYERGNVHDGIWPSYIEDAVLAQLPVMTRKLAETYNAAARAAGDNMQVRLAALATLQNDATLRAQRSGTQNSAGMQALQADIASERRSIMASM
jgi:hypothetical protein